MKKSSSAAPGDSLRTTVWITGDQCSPYNSALAGCEPAFTRVLMIESTTGARTRPYHKRKLVLIYAVMRHFARDLRAAGWTVDYHAECADDLGALELHLADWQPERLRLMAQSEFGVTDGLLALVAGRELPCEVLPHCNFISEPGDFDRLAKSDSARVTMENFYRGMRKKTGLLMDGSEPVGGAWNYDAENREPPKAGMRFPAARAFEPDSITRDVIAMVERQFADHPGTIGTWSLPVDRRDALALLDDFILNRLDGFGPHQDAMILGERTMNHSLLSAAINVGLLHPLECCERAELAYRSGEARLQSVEGFIRQVIGWREYIWRIYWKTMPSYRTRNTLAATLPLPRFFWTGETDMNCLREALAHVRETAYAHHILRLMILGNFALIAGFEPQETNDWFWAMFIDGYDWVMVPNVIGMTLHADGGYVGTKPYAASANYINKMSNYCRPCRYDPKQTEGEEACPFNSLYWDFLARNETRFVKNVRMTMVVKNWQRRPDATKVAIRARAARVLECLRTNARI